MRYLIIKCNLLFLHAIKPTVRGILRVSKETPLSHPGSTGTGLTQRKKDSVATAPGRNHVHKALLDKILQAELRPGARLVETQIASLLAVSRTPVREALLRLEREGFVVSEPHRGFSVSALDERAAREVFPMVGALQGLAIAETGPILASIVDPLRRSNAQMRSSATPAQAMAADSEFHRLLVSLCPNARLIALIETLHKQLLRYEHIYMSDVSLIETSFAQHCNIVDAIEQGNVAAAERSVRTNYASGLAIVISKLRETM
jgi:DNA-binding GntR family transcriptional regulator